MPSVTVGDPDEAVTDAGPNCEWGAAAPSVENRIKETTRSTNARPFLPCSWRALIRFFACIGTMNLSGGIVERASRPQVRQRGRDASATTCWFMESLRGTRSIALRFCQRPVACSLCAMRFGRWRDRTVEQGGQSPASGIGPETVLESAGRGERSESRPRQRAA